MGRWANKYVIGLTGNIAMGKSTVRKMLENLGAYTIDADALSHQAMAPGAPSYAPVVETFGKWVVGPDGRIDRAKLGAIVFAHPDALTELERLTHPIVSQAIDLLVNRATQPIVVVEAIKVIDGTLGQQVDSIWVVDANAENQVRRLTSRRNMTETDARQRIAAQNPQFDKLTRANVVINNNGSPEDLWAQVQRGWESAQRTISKPDSPAPVDPGATRALDPAAIAPHQALKPSALTATPNRSAAQPLPMVTQVPPTPAEAQPAPMVTYMPPPAPTVLTPAAFPTSPAGAPATLPLSPASLPPTQPAPPQTAPATPPAPAPAPISRLPQTGRLTLPNGDNDSTILVEIRRGKPENTEAIARLLSQSSRKLVTPSDVMLAFGEKSFFLAESAGRSIGLIGFQVENLITRISEVITVPEVPVGPVVNGLLTAVENAARQLQSEVAFIAVSASTPTAITQAFMVHGYERITVDSLRIPAWREAAAEMQVPGTQVLMRRLRESLVLTPV